MYSNVGGVLRYNMASKMARISMNPKRNITTSFSLNVPRKHISDLWALMLSLDTRSFYSIQTWVPRDH